jgi:hypothetical protein
MRSSRMRSWWGRVGGGCEGGATCPRDTCLPEGGPDAAVRVWYGRRRGDRSNGTVERALNHKGLLLEEQQRTMLDRFVPSLAAKMGLEAPPEDRRLRFLEDLLAAELRSRNRLLG